MDHQSKLRPEANKFHSGNGDDGRHYWITPEDLYLNPPFGSIIHQGKKKGPTAWARKAIQEHAQGKKVVMVYPIDKWVLMLLAAGAKVRNLGDVRWLSTEDRKAGKGTGRHIAAFILDAGR